MVTVADPRESFVLVLHSKASLAFSLLLENSPREATPVAVPSTLHLPAMQVTGIVSDQERTAIA